MLECLNFEPWSLFGFLPENGNRGFDRRVQQNSRQGDQIERERVCRLAQSQVRPTAEESCLPPGRGGRRGWGGIRRRGGSRESPEAEADRWRSGGEGEFQEEASWAHTVAARGFLWRRRVDATAQCPGEKAATTGGCPLWFFVDNFTSVQTPEILIFRPLVLLCSCSTRFVSIRRTCGPRCRRVARRRRSVPALRRSTRLPWVFWSVWRRRRRRRTKIRCVFHHSLTKGNLHHYT